LKRKSTDNLEQDVPLNQDAVDSLVKQYEAAFDKEAPGWLKNLKTRTTEFVETQALDAYLQDLNNRNLLTTRELNRYLTSHPDLGSEI